MASTIPEARRPGDEESDAALAERLARLIWLLNGSGPAESPGRLRRSRRMVRLADWKALARDPSGRRLRRSLIGSTSTNDAASAVLADEYALLPKTDRVVLDALVLHRSSRDDAAKSTGLTPDEVTSIAGHALRRLHFAYRKACG